MKPIPSLPIPPCFLLFVFSLVFTWKSQAQGIISDYQQFLKAYNEKNYEECVQFGAPLAKVKPVILKLKME